MWTIMHLVTKVFDVLLAPFSSLSPLVGLTWISLLTGVGMLMVYRYISNQDRIKETKNRIKAHFLEVRLFKDNMRVMLKAQKNILLYNFRYMGLAVKPMLFMLPPIILILIQLEVRYARRPLHVGESAIVSVKMESDPMKGPEMQLVVPSGITIETPPLRVPEGGEINWRIKANQAGRFSIGIKSADSNSEVSKTVHVTRSVVALAGNVGRSSLSEAIVQPVEKPIISSVPIESVRLQYPNAEMKLWGWNIHWLVGFFVLSIVFGFAMKGIFKVEI